MRDRTHAVRLALEKGEFTVEEGKWTLRATRREVEQGWRAVGEVLVAQGRPELAAEVRRFAQQLPSPLSERERMAATLMAHGIKSFNCPPTR